MQVPIELKMRYLDRKVQDIQRLRQGLETGDYSFAAKVGHQVKGNAVTFEIPQMAFIGVEMEKAANKKDRDKVELLISKMETLILSAKSHYH